MSNLTQTNLATRTIQCIPKSICSWDYWLKTNEGTSSLTIGTMLEQGTISHAGRKRAVVKHGWLSGRWTLGTGNDKANAYKTSAFSNTFLISDRTGKYRLSSSIFGREFTLKRGNELLAKFTPDHMFTRRATIQVRRQECEFTTLLFCFWLVALMWKRAANQSA